MNTTSYLPVEINQLLGIMGSQIRLEVTSKKKSSSSLDSATSSRLSPAETHASSDGSNCLWRGLQIYDADLHTVRICKVFFVFFLCHLHYFS